ncbi:MAG TPA: glycosyl transferase family 1, partial [Deinococcales bacterium]|nr:glycosyl transferase family 1 [Deinococcales bacterium]
MTPRRGRHDLIADTRHDVQAAADYRLLAGLGIRTVREGLRWHLIEQRPGRYDFASLEPMVRAARETGTQIVWDLFHYGWPDGLDVFSADFADRFLSFADAGLRYLRRELDGPLVVCPVNEPSFFSWGAGDHGLFHPFERGRGWELKKILARAAIGASRLARAVDRNAVLIHPDPLVNVARNPERPELDEAAVGYHRAQWDGWNLITGRMEPELGGDPGLVDF